MDLIFCAGCDDYVDVLSSIFFFGLLGFDFSTKLRQIFAPGPVILIQVFFTDHDD